MLSLSMVKDSKDYSLESLITKMNDISDEWHPAVAKGDQGAGRTLEKLLGVEENNISLPDYGSIEIKSKIADKDDLSKGLISLFTKEPLNSTPNASVPNLIRAMGWRHEKAGTKYPDSEQAFNTTINMVTSTNRGFEIDVTEDKIYIKFDPKKVISSDPDRSKGKYYKTLGDWLNDIETRTNPHYSDIMPLYYNKPDIENQFVKKLNKTFFCLCRKKKVNDILHYQFFEGYILFELDENKISEMLKKGLYIDFGSRTKHNHGTKLRIVKENLFKMFTKVEKVL